VLLTIKKEVEWIQPSSHKGVERQTAPIKNLAKVLPSDTNWEVQVDTHTSEVLQVAQRRSDVIEAIHEGSNFTD
jgi:hypothetical protein